MCGEFCRITAESDEEKPVGCCLLSASRENCHKIFLLYEINCKHSWIILLRNSFLATFGDWRFFSNSTYHFIRGCCSCLISNSAVQLCDCLNCIRILIRRSSQSILWLICGAKILDFAFLHHSLCSRKTSANKTCSYFPQIKKLVTLLFLSAKYFFFWQFPALQLLKSLPVSNPALGFRLKLWEQATGKLNTLDISTSAPCLGTFPTLRNFSLLLGI